MLWLGIKCGNEKACGIAINQPKHGSQKQKLLLRYDRELQNQMIAMWFGKKERLMMIVDGMGEGRSKKDETDGSQENFGPTRQGRRGDRARQAVWR